MLKVTWHTGTSRCAFGHDGMIMCVVIMRSCEYRSQQLQRGGEEKVTLAGTADSWVQSGSEVRHRQQWGSAEESKTTGRHTHTHTHL